MGPAQKRERLRRFEELCRRRGLSLTVQRRLILETVLDRTDHPTADQTYDAVKCRIPGVSRTTVYRALATFVDIGVITKASSPGTVARFDPMTDRHHHLVCLYCDRLIDLDDGQFHHRVELPDVRSHSFEIRDFSIHFNGVCGACRKRLEPKHTAAPLTDGSGVGKSTRRKKTRQGRTRRATP